MIQSASFLRAAVDNETGGVAGKEEQDLFITESPIDILGLLQRAHHPSAGALVLFSGEVRDANRGKSVERLEYEAHVALASRMIGEILRDAIEKWGLTLAIAQHRTGKVKVGETAVVVITASPHRSEAFAANRHIIDRIKHEAPIWKCEYYSDGSSEWGNNCHCQERTNDVHKHYYEST